MLAFLSRIKDMHYVDTDSLRTLSRLHLLYEDAADPNDDSAGANEAAELSRAVGALLAELGFECVI